MKKESMKDLSISKARKGKQWVTCFTNLSKSIKKTVLFKQIVNEQVLLNETRERKLWITTATGTHTQMHTRF